MILVLGAGGMLGSEIAQQMWRSQIHGTSVTRSEVDITSVESINKCFETIKPTTVINCAAFTPVDECEADARKAYTCNAEAVEYLSAMCEKYSANFIHLSTDYVFSGDQKGLYHEDDSPRPLQVYGHSKLLGEIFAINARDHVLRIQAVYGNKRKNTTDWVIDSILKKEKVSMSISQITSPCSTQWLALHILDFAQDLPDPGMYHLTHDDFASRFEVAEFIAKGLEIDPDFVIQPMLGADFGPAKRPLRTVMCSQKFKEAMDIPSLGSWKNDLVNYIRNVRKLPFYGSKEIEWI